MGAMVPIVRLGPGPVTRAGGGRSPTARVEPPGSSGQNRGVERTRRVAVTVEQCWHHVPGGAATSILGTLEALGRRSDVELVGVAARHREPPPPLSTAGPRCGTSRYPAWRSTKPGMPCAGRRSSGPPDRSTSSTSSGMAMPPPSAPLVVTVHDLAFLEDPSRGTRHGLQVLRSGHRVGPARRVVGRACPSVDTWNDCVTLRVRPGPTAARAVGGARPWRPRRPRWRRSGPATAWTDRTF